MSIIEAYRRVMDEVESECEAAGRSPEEITVIAVSKTFPTSTIREAVSSGIRILGENRVQELVAKVPELAEFDLEWHMIGHLQTNKVRAVVPLVHMIHSVDRESLAVEIDRRAGEQAPVPILMQVNTSGEASKSGVAPDTAGALFEQLLALPSLKPRGLMTIGPLGGDERQVRDAFATLRETRDRLQSSHREADLSILSMGMSGDFGWAIREGATHVRIGSRIFGERPKPPLG